MARVALAGATVISLAAFLAILAVAPASGEEPAPQRLDAAALPDGASPLVPPTSPTSCPDGMALVPAYTPAHVHDGPTAINPATHAFCMDILETTHADYAKCVANKQCTPLRREGRWASRSRYPVMQATFDQALAYCKFRNKRVPTPYEWVRAAGGDKELWHPWGDTWLQGGKDPCLRRSQPAAVGTCKVDKSQFGIFDMALNVTEWVYGTPDHRDEGSVAGSSWESQSLLKTVGIDWYRPHAGIRCVFDFLN